MVNSFMSPFRSILLSIVIQKQNNKVKQQEILKSKIAIFELLLSTQKNGKRKLVPYSARFAFCIEMVWTIG